MGNGQRAMGNRQWSVVNGEWAREISAFGL
jgi:hypothetical protein